MCAHNNILHPYKGLWTEHIFYPPIKHGYIASICGKVCDRACYIHLEEQEKLKNSFTSKFRKREEWTLNLEDT